MALELMLLVMVQGHQLHLLDQLLSRVLNRHLLNQQNQLLHRRGICVSLLPPPLVVSRKGTTSDQ